jgi:hypothetical protein
MTFSRERWVMLSILAAAAAACLLGAADPVSTSDHGHGVELLGLVRVACTAALAVTLLLGPGILLRPLADLKVGLGFLPLPGLGLLAATGGLAWLLAGTVEPQVVCFAVFAPALGLLLGALLSCGPDDLLDPEESRVLGLVSLMLGIAVARSIWSLSTVGELYEGTISRNLVAEGRPDSRISYFIPQLIANHRGPYSSDSNYLFAPYNFSSRGPLAGLASSPIVFLTGGQPELGSPEAGWSPFDAQGFMAYRLAMMSFSCTIMLSLWELVRRIGGSRAARLAVLLGVATPYLYADLWFTWPKLLAASFVVLGALCVIQRRSFRGGLLVGVGYLFHPSALLGLSGVGLLSVWPLQRPRWLRPNLKAAILLALGVGIFMAGWRLLNGSHYFQGPFFEYVTEAYPNYHPPLDTWLHFRLASLANTVVPLYLPFAYGHNISINTVGGVSPGVVHFFFQYWTGVPFGFAIVFLPLLLNSLWRALRRWPWPVLATVFVPFALFLVYWGASITGILREGMQWWVPTLLAVIALQQSAEGFPWLRSRLIRGVLALRGAEVLALAVGPVLGTHHLDPIGSARSLNDAVAFGAIVILALTLIVVTWRGSGRLAAADADPGAAAAPG